MDVKLYPHSETALCTQCDHAFKHNGFKKDPMIPIMDALRNYYFPEGREARDIVEAMGLIDLEFERYDPEISRVRAILETLERKRKSLEVYQERYRSVLSPVRKLPPEILQTIFLICRGSDPRLLLPVVDQVCHRWREVALQTPELWAIVSIGRTRFTYTQRNSDLVALFLERSAARMVSLTIWNPVDPRLLQLVSGHCSRWHTLRISSANEPFYGVLARSLSLHETYLPALERLEIATAYSEPGAEGDAIEIFEHAPKLWDVVLKNSLEFWRLPWKQLTRIQYDVSAARDGLQIFQLCPHLVECSIDRLRVPAEQDHPSPFRPSSQLRHLRLSQDTLSAQGSNAILRDFFACVTAPNLVSLEVIGQFKPADLTDFLSRNRCQLENLTLGPGYMKDTTIISVLEHLPELKSLVLDADIGTSRQLQNRVISSALLRRLTLYPESDCLLPSLTHLTLKTAVNFQDSELLDVIESRWIPWVAEVYGVPVVRLTSIDVHLCGKREHLSYLSSIEQLRGLFAAGLKVSLQQGTQTVSLSTADADLSLPPRSVEFETD
ncbi:hypothetical protein C8J57DRAFT_260219 [Mycena rebaudengoi]|nr:hypothetical protein C8J57DRAFT_260219 [Mycena rebaudengoi]